MQAASLIVEAEVLDARGEWDATHAHIFTRQRLRVFRVLKGTLPDTAALPLLVEGGQVGLARQVLTNTLGPLPVGQQGIFFWCARRGRGRARLRGLRLQPGRYHLQPGPGHRRRTCPRLPQLGGGRPANRAAQRPAAAGAASQSGPAGRHPAPGGRRDSAHAGPGYQRFQPGPDYGRHGRGADAAGQRLWQQPGQRGR
ncbi:MAG: hypothetical protein WKG07_14190 [Hymenobacter sp.]